MAKPAALLSEAMFYILSALSEPRHGYAISQHVSEQSDDRVRLGPGTLYGALTTLTERGWIEHFADGSDHRRKAYRLTEAGILALREERARLQEMLAQADRALAKIGSKMDE